MSFIDALKSMFLGDKKPVEQPKTTLEVDVSNEPVVLEAKSRAKELVLEARDSALKIKADAEEYASKAKSGLSEKEKDLAIKQAQVDAKASELEERARTLKKAKDAIDKLQLDADEYIKKQKEQLEKVAALTAKEAREELLAKVDKELNEEKAKKIREMTEDVKRSVEEESKQLLVEAMRYGATDYIVEYTTSKVKLTEDDLKGRIIGKEGRNIKSFEELTGVELDLDSSPGEIIVSSFDSVRREVAKLSLERLIKDGRIQPAKIEEIVKKTQEEVDHLIYKAGDDLCHRVGVYNLPKDLV
ncbi:DUF3552 domain-containing protein, partial [Patescibacteria group bacterium]|nr:DUF3552 domain-containing protein [Patescibacteria group bacterium]